MSKRFLVLAALAGVTALLVTSVAGARTEARNAVAHVTLLTGAAEVDAAGNPNQGDPNGIGAALVVLLPGSDTVCWRIVVRGIQRPLAAAHIHRAAAGANGPVVVDFSAQLRGCTAVEATLFDEILGNPAGFYVNVHNAEFPTGALRGQLA